MDKSLGTLLHFWGVFQFTQAQPLPSPHKQCWMRVSRIIFGFQLCIGWGEGKLQENFKKDVLFYEGTEKQGCQKVFRLSRLVMNSRRLWNLDQSHMFLRAEASRDILKLRASEMAFSVVFKRYFPPQTQCFLIRIHARLGTMPLKCPRRSTASHGSHV